LLNLTNKIAILIIVDPLLGSGDSSIDSSISWRPVAILENPKGSEFRWTLKDPNKEESQQVEDGELSSSIEELGIEWILALFARETLDPKHLDCLESLLAFSDEDCFEILIQSKVAGRPQYAYQKRLFRSKVLPLPLPLEIVPSDLMASDFYKDRSVRSCVRVSTKNLLQYGYHQIRSGDMFLSDFSPTSVSQEIAFPSFGDRSPGCDPDVIIQKLSRLSLEDANAEELLHLFDSCKWCVPVVFMLGRLFRNLKQWRLYSNCLYQQWINLLRPRIDFSYPFDLEIFHDWLLRPMAELIGQAGEEYFYAAEFPFPKIEPFKGSYRIAQFLLVDQNIFKECAKTITLSHGFHPLQYPYILAQHRAKKMNVSVSDAEWWTGGEPIFLRHSEGLELAGLLKERIGSVPICMKIEKITQERHVYESTSCLHEVGDVVKDLAQFLSGEGDCSLCNQVGTRYTYFQKIPSIR
jgi:hypothetical protein